MSDLEGWSRLVEKNEKEDERKGESAQASKG